MSPSSPDFGLAASDYADARLGFPEIFFDRLATRGAFRGGDHVVDLGTGTGTVARGLARRGCQVVGVDISEALLTEARRLANAEGLHITWRCAPAEHTGLAEASAHVVLAGQCWHWFDRPAAAAEAFRLLVPGGRAILAHFDFISSAPGLVADTLGLVHCHGRWPEETSLGIDGIYPRWLADLAAAGFTKIESSSWDIAARYSLASWRRRMHASAALCDLDASALAAFDVAFDAEVAPRHPEPLSVPHRVFIVMGVKPLE